MSVAIRFEAVSKKYQLHKYRSRSFQETFVNIFQRKRLATQDFWVLKDISFTIQPGEAVALVGPNGAGKSTLLKLVSQIIMPTAGQIEINGLVSSLLELGTGFHPDLSGRENIYLNGSLLGLKKADIDEKYDEIVAFSELGDFIDLPVKHYSSGMYMRLGFAVAIHVDPDILLIDEAMAVGDHAFQQKCLKRIVELQASGVTFLLVSHNMETVREYCKRGIWMQDGAIKADGSIERVAEAYLTNLYERHHRRQLASQKQTGTEDNINRWGTKEIDITGVELLNQIEESQTVFKVGETWIIRIHYMASIPIKNPVFGIAIYCADGVHINGPNTRQANFNLNTVYGSGYVDYTVEALNLLPGSYEVSVAVYDSEVVQAYDHHHRLYRFQVLSGQIEETFGVFYLPSSWKHIANNNKNQPVHSGSVDTNCSTNC